MTRSKNDEIEPVVSDTGLVVQDEFGLLSFDDLMAYEGLEDLNDIAPSAILDKADLVGVPFVALTWSFRKGDYGEESEYVSMQIVTDKNIRGVMNDGSTGVKDQMKMITSRMIASDKGMRPLVCRGGLTKSEYNHPQYGPGATYYLASVAK